MRFVLELRSPSDGAGWAERWSVSGADGRALHECLQQLGDHVTDPPLEVWDSHRLRHVIRDGDRWRAAMLLWPDESSSIGVSFEPVRAMEAWTADGARCLAELLPERLVDMRDGIRERFSA